MARLATPSSLADSGSLESKSQCDIRETEPPSSDPLGKRLFGAVAKKLQTSPLAYSVMVRTFRTLQRCGINATPNHFYWPVPDLSELEKREWATFPPPPGCDFGLSRQAQLAREFAQHYMPEFQFDSQPTDHAYHHGNGYFESCDAEVAYCMVRKWKPQRIIEIGSGYSTRVLAAALRANLERDSVAGELLTIDPHLERVPGDGLGNMVTIVGQPVQSLPVDTFRSLGSGDILFIDSSHVAGIGSDVVREFLQILPTLNPGVVVHLHDIFLPFDYPRDKVFENLWFWSEQYLLQTFLTFNSEFEVLWSASAMQEYHAAVLDEAFPKWRESYGEVPASEKRFIPTRDGEHAWPTSFWMRRVQR
jgi:predicted O-methyltransferase YrrM